MKTGPSRKTSSDPRRVSEPVRSEGRRSGVNCTRRASSPHARPMAEASSVLATPGGPSRRRWPPTASAADHRVDHLALTDHHLGHLGVQRRTGCDRSHHRYRASLSYPTSCVCFEPCEGTSQFHRVSIRNRRRQNTGRSPLRGRATLPPPGPSHRLRPWRRCSIAGTAAPAPRPAAGRRRRKSARRACSPASTTSADAYSTLAGISCRSRRSTGPKRRAAENIQTTTAANPSTRPPAPPDRQSGQPGTGPAVSMVELVEDTLPGCGPRQVQAERSVVVVRQRGVGQERARRHCHTLRVARGCHGAGHCERQSRRAP